MTYVKLISKLVFVICVIAGTISVNASNLDSKINRRISNAPNSKWKTFANKYAPYFTFQYSSSWFQVGPNLYDGIVGQLFFTNDSVSDYMDKTNVTIAFHQQQFSLIQWAEENWKPNKWITVAGCKALEIYSVSNKTGKENVTLKTPLVHILVYFVDKKHNGTMDIQFSTPVTNKAEVRKFYKLLSSFKLIE